MKLKQPALPFGEEEGSPQATLLNSTRSSDRAPDTTGQVNPSSPTSVARKVRANSEGELPRDRTEVRATATPGGRRGNVGGGETEASAHVLPDGRSLRSHVDAVARLWAEHQGWPVGRWPRARRYDAILIAQYVRRFGGDLLFWRSLFALVPRDASFVLLTTPPRAGEVPWIDEAWSRYRDANYGRLKQQWREESHSVGAILRRMIGGIDGHITGQEAP